MAQRSGIVKVKQVGSPSETELSFTVIQAECLIEFEAEVDPIKESDYKITGVGYPNKSVKITFGDGQLFNDVTVATDADGKFEYEVIETLTYGMEIKVAPNVPTTHTGIETIEVVQEDTTELDIDTITIGKADGEGYVNTIVSYMIVNPRNMTWGEGEVSYAEGGLAVTYQRMAGVSQAGKYSEVRFKILGDIGTMPEAVTEVEIDFTEPLSFLHPNAQEETFSIVFTKGEEGANVFFTDHMSVAYTTDVPYVKAILPTSTDNLLPREVKVVTNHYIGGTLVGESIYEALLIVTGELRYKERHTHLSVYPHKEIPQGTTKRSYITDRKVMKNLSMVGVLGDEIEHTKSLSAINEGALPQAQSEEIVYVSEFNSLIIVSTSIYG